MAPGFGTVGGLCMRAVPATGVGYPALMPGMPATCAVEADVDNPGVCGPRVPPE